MCVPVSPCVCVCVCVRACVRVCVCDFCVNFLHMHILDFTMCCESHHTGVCITASLESSTAVVWQVC